MDVQVKKQSIAITALKWKDKKTLKKEGYNLSSIDEKQDNDALVERVLELSLGDTVDLDELDVNEVYRLFGEVMRISFMGPEAVKN